MHYINTLCVRRHAHNYLLTMILINDILFLFLFDLRESYTRYFLYDYGIDCHLHTFCGSVYLDARERSFD